MQSRKQLNKWTSQATAYLAALVFAVAAVAKLGGWMSDAFAAWGYSIGLMIAVGVVELTGAIGLVYERLRGWAALILGIVMLGAVATHLSHGDTDLVVVPIAMLVLLSYVFASHSIAPEPTARRHVVATEVEV